MKNIDLIQRWRKLFENSGTNEVDSIYCDVLDRYSESHRHYHTIDHVKACLRHLDSVENIVNRREVEIAFWFHDVIYNPLKNDNEDQSAVFACSALAALGENDEIIDGVKHLVVLTKHPSDPKELHEKYLIDIDLSILGSSEDVYGNYEHWIRQEYSKIPTILYKRGRKKVLRSFLEQPKIYSTELFHGKYEASARTNLENALSSL
jgi:predicted metal-dependent HD superfamily phosphohydrolase